MDHADDTPRYRVTRVFNNNVLGAVSSNGERVIITGRGLGWGVSRGSVLSSEGIESTYVMEDDRSARRADQAPDGIDEQVVDVAKEIVDAASERIDLRSPGSLILPIADHVAFLQERVAHGIEVDFPLEWDVRQTYPEEVAVGALAVRIIENRLGIHADPSEETAFAMHFVAAQTPSRDISGVASATTLIRDLLELIAREPSVPPSESTGDSILISHESLPVRRFITHVRYLLARLEERAIAGASCPSRGEPGAVGDPIARFISEETSVDTRAVTDELTRVIEQHLRVQLSTDERAYLLLHVHQIRTRL